ncbi:hypothetical protein [Novosphingobium mangrovi (ex Hu et al. 2023)]|uniref:Uncharacterized protein n=1 Tax=Novosphingobium mangrovi (ex Hu et al. 2023) TaxID=2930094 RepID=A0ABT0AHT5_9SPHN|nr:hypothetical protein [Novosphingobium mangrovi (ex Hu et al. 2023)]MCJ1962738.1 hypothetical protein [Novosphingobium mangrovi (ex Hu et al. 2023)]
MKAGLTFLAALAAVIAAPGQARDVMVEVDARAQPWDEDAFEGMSFGKGDGEAPLRIMGFEDLAGANVAIIPVSGGVTLVEGAEVGPEGIVGDAADDLRVKKRVYPSLYTPKVLYPVYRHALLAVFTDDEGRPVGRPFPVGTGVRVGVPDEARGLSLGFNDITFKDNAGTLQVILQIPD